LKHLGGNQMTTIRLASRASRTVHGSIPGTFVGLHRTSGGDRTTKAKKEGLTPGPLLVFGMVIIVITSLMWSLSSAGATDGRANDRRTWFVDCSALHHGVGTMGRPFDSLQAPNHLTLHGGDRLLFRRGGVCHGMLALRGGGSFTHPVVIGAYGSGKARPEIDGQGKVDAAVRLADMSYVTVQG